MPSKLVRIVLDLTSNQFIVEYGERRIPGLTPAQQEEMKQLNEELMEFSDFALAEKLEDEEQQALMAKKKRLMELAELEVGEHFEWYPIEAHLIESLFIVVSPNLRHTYVENLPPNLIEKLLEPQITLNFGTGQGPISVTSATEASPPDDLGDLQSHTPNEIEVIGVIAQDTPNWPDFVAIKEEKPGVVFVRPPRYLKDDWTPINRAIRAAFGGDCWITKGKGDTTAHWECKIK